MNDEHVHRAGDGVYPIPWAGEGSVPIQDTRPITTPARRRTGLVLASMALALTAGIGAVTISRLPLADHEPGFGSGTSQAVPGDDTGAPHGSGTAAQAPADRGEEHDD